MLAIGKIYDKLIKAKRKDIEMQLIATFEIDLDGEIRAFSIKADAFKLFIDGGYAVCSHGDIELYEIDGNGIEVPYTVEAVSWAGRHLDEEDALEQIASAYVNGLGNYSFSYVCDEIEQFRQRVLANIACVYDGIEIPRHLFDFSKGLVFDLVFATDLCSYYTCDESVLMILNRNWTIVSDNYFAEEGMFTSAQAVHVGEEVKVWLSEDQSVKDWFDQIAVED